MAKVLVLHTDQQEAAGLTQLACLWTDSWPVCAAGLAFGTFANAGRCFWQFSSALPGIFREIRKGADYKAFYAPLFTLPELLDLKANVPEFAGLSDDQVQDAYAIMGGIARPVLFMQFRGNKSMADLRNDVKAKIAEMGKTGWEVRRGAAWAARTWDARAACFSGGAHAWNDQCACAFAFAPARTMTLMLRSCRVAPIAFHLHAMPQISPPCLDAGAIQHPGGIPRWLRYDNPLGRAGGLQHPATPRAQQP